MIRADGPRNDSQSPPEPLASKISPRARAAIARAVLRGAPVAELEYLGFTTRYINLLENSRYTITTLEQLLSLRPDDLHEISNFGAGGWEQLVDCLGRYDQLEDARRKAESDLRRQRANRS